MYGRIDFGNIIINMFMFSFLFGAIFYIGMAQGYIEINRPYLQELKTCEANLEVLEEKVTPDCPAVVCKSDGGLNSIIGFIMFFVMFTLYIFEKDRNQRLKQNKKKVKK